jgi:hypothetical protein
MRKRTAILLAIGLCFAAYVFYGLAEVEPIKVTTVKLIHTGDQVFVQGELRNSGATTGPVAVEVRLFDSSGHRVAVDTVAIGEMKTGAVTGFKSPARAAAGVSEYSIDLNHGRNPYGN